MVHVHQKVKSDEPQIERSPSLEKHRPTTTTCLLKIHQLLWAHTHIHTHTHTFSHIHIHTHTHCIQPQQMLTQAHLHKALIINTDRNMHTHHIMYNTNSYAHTFTLPVAAMRSNAGQCVFKWALMTNSVKQMCETRLDFVHSHCGQTRVKSWKLRMCKQWLWRISEIKSGLNRNIKYCYSAIMRLKSQKIN